MIEVQFKSNKKAFFFFLRIPGVLFIVFIVLEGPAILGESHFRGVDCLQMLKVRQQKKVFRSFFFFLSTTLKKFLKYE